MIGAKQLAAFSRMKRTVLFASDAGRRTMIRPAAAAAPWLGTSAATAHGAQRTITLP